MKKDLHPTYYPEAKIICACGNVIVTGSTQEELHTELCSACHPFFTGKQKLVDSAGRGDRFRAQMEKAAKLKADAVERKSKKKAAVKVIEDVTKKKA